MDVINIPNTNYIMLVKWVSGLKDRITAEC